MAYVATPYDNSRSTNTIAELMLRQGQIRAQGLRAQGDASAAIAGSLGDLAVNGTRNVLAAREQARQQQRQQTQDAERTAANDQARRLGAQQEQVNTNTLAQQGQAAAAQAAALRSKQLADHARQSFTMGNADKDIEQLRASDPNAADLFQKFVDDQRGRQDEQRRQLIEIARRTNYNPDYVASAAGLDWHPGAVENYIQSTNGGSDPAKVREFVEIQAAGLKMAPPTLKDHDPSHSVIDDLGRVVLPAVTPPAKVTFGQPVVQRTTGGKEISVRPGSDGKPYDMQGNLITEPLTPRPQAQGAGAGVVNGGLDEAGLDLAATRNRLFGTYPARDSKQNAAITNRAAELAKQLGHSPVDTILKQEGAKADTAALRKITGMAASAEAFEAKANAQAGLVSQLSEKVSRTDFPVINGVLQSGKEAFGNTDAHLFGNAVLTFTQEYAKVMTGSTGSASASTDAAQKEAAKLISTALSKGTIAKTVQQMQWEMQQTMLGYDATRQHITERMGGQAPATTTPTTIGRFQVTVEP